jgi:hypothetical protein
MKYLCLIYSNEQMLHTSPDSPADPECFAYAEAIQVAGGIPAARVASVEVRPVRELNL